MAEPTEHQQKQEWTAQQLVLKQRLVEHDVYQWDLLDNTAKEAVQKAGGEASFVRVRKLQRVAGVDISFVEGSTIHACACLVVLSFPALELLYEAFTYVALPAPYISGFLAFREVPALEKLYQDLTTRCPEFIPDITLVDGNGILHPQGFGLASHFGVLMGIPTIGIGKTFLHVDGLTKGDVNQLRAAKEKQEQATGDLHSKECAGFQALPLTGESGKTWGAAFWGTPTIQNPIFVSIGNQLSLATCLQVVGACCRYRIPEPIRQADLRSREVIRQWHTQGLVDETLDAWYRGGKS